tara:strand:+ start:934 stop:2199 length:1266 start_codon:yes stop_codon:yes gene_type:complete
MSDYVIEIKNLSKKYQLGIISTGTLAEDLSRIWSRYISKNNSNLPIFENDTSSINHNNKKWALKNINLNIKRGDVVGIIGNNGAGKSTLLKVLSRITSPTTGMVKIEGRIASLLEVGTGFHPELTGKENIFLNGAILGMSMSEINQKLDKIIDFSGINLYIDTPVKRYSSGMRVRLAFSVAAHLDPEILLIDEVLAVGDADFQRKCLGKIKNISEVGRTVLFVSHNMTAVKSLCNKAIVIDEGKIIYENNSIEAVNYYLTRGSKEIIDEYKWNIDNAIGDSRLKILGVKIISQKGNYITVDSGFKIKIKCLTSMTKSPLNMGIAIFSNDGLMLTHSYLPVVDPELLKPGYYTVTALIPPSIFNQGIYNLKVWYGLSNNENLGTIDDKLSFEIIASNSKHSMNDSRALLNLDIHFSTKYISD